jgi:hypothetical protein
MNKEIINEVEKLQEIVQELEDLCKAADIVRRQREKEVGA